MKIIQRRKIWYGISLSVIVPGVIALLLWGLPLGLDFRGGTLMEMEGVSDVAKTKQIIADQKIENFSVVEVSGGNLLMKSSVISEESHNKLKEAITKDFKNFKETRFETIGTAVSAEITRNAFLATLLASCVIIFYVAWAFRKVSHPIASWKYGVCAIIALIHDALVVIGTFAILGHFFEVEIDSSFVTAVLTVVSFSVHDTIVIFDRIRENLKKRWGEDFEEVINESIIEMLPRTLSTSFVIFVVLFSLLLFGGISIRYFALVLTIGIVAGTYSSIMDASPLLITWYNLEKRFKRKAD